MPTNAPLNRKLRMGLIGGGQGAFIGRVHATAAVLDNRAALVAGALSSDPAKAKASAPDYDIKPERAYGSYREMLDKELKLPAAERIDFVAVATPNHTHYEIAKAFAEAGFNVMCDKPLTFDLAQAEDLAKVVQKSGVVFAVTHNYTGHPLVRQARDMVRSGELGEINAVRAFYIQGWLRTRLELGDQKQASWRTDPKRTGAAGCFGDIGTHAYNLTPIHHRPDPRADFVHPEDFRAGPAGRRLRHGHDPLPQRRPGHRDGLADQPWPGKRHLDRGGRHQGVAGMAPGRAEQDDRPRQRPAAQDLHARRRPLSDRRPPPRPAASPAAIPKATWKRSPTSTPPRMTTWPAGPAGRSSRPQNTLYPNVADGVDGMNFITQAVASSQKRRPVAVAEACPVPFVTIGTK